MSIADENPINRLPALRDLTNVAELDQLLARYHRAGLAERHAREFRREVRQRIIDALAGSPRGFTDYWEVWLREQEVTERTIPAHIRRTLTIAPAAFRRPGSC